MDKLIGLMVPCCKVRTEFEINKKGSLVGSCPICGQKWQLISNATLEKVELDEKSKLVD